MKPNRLLLATLCWLPLAATAQQSNTLAAKSPAQVQPQAWPAPNAPAQPQATAPAPAPPAAVPPDAVSPRRPDGQILLDVVVTDKAGKPITGLDRSDFTLLDNNHPAEIQSFEAYGGSKAASEQPTQIILVIDTVNIGFDQVSYSRFGIDQFLRSDGGRLGVPLSIYWYTDTGLRGLAGATAPSTDGNTLATQLDATAGNLRTINRSAGAWGAIERFQMSVQTMNNVVRAAAAQPGRKLLIWIGPGWPILDNPNLQMTWKDQQRLFGNIVDMSTLLRQAQMQIYSVSTGMPNSFTYLYESYTKGVKKAAQAYLPNLDLKVLAVESGGFALAPSNDLAAEIEKCVREAADYYTLGFTPPPADGPNEYHELKVRVDKAGITARTDTGYYNQPEGKEIPR
jgi:VWFA-related protein